MLKTHFRVGFADSMGFNLYWGNIGWPRTRNIVTLSPVCWYTPGSVAGAGGALQPDPRGSTRLDSSTSLLIPLGNTLLLSHKRMSFLGHQRRNEAVVNWRNQVQKRFLIMARFFSLLLLIPVPDPFPRYLGIDSWCLPIYYGFSNQEWYLFLSIELRREDFPSGNLFNWTES